MQDFEDDRSVTEWLRDMKGGDEEAVGHIWERFVVRLRSAARKREVGESVLGGGESMRPIADLVASGEPGDAVVAGVRRQTLSSRNTASDVVRRPVSSRTP